MQEYSQKMSDDMWLAYCRDPIVKNCFHASAVGGLNYAEALEFTIDRLIEMLS